MRKSSLSCSRGFASFFVRVADGFALQQKVTLAGLEIHWALPQGFESPRCRLRGNECSRAAAHGCGVALAPAGVCSSLRCCSVGCRFGGQSAAAGGAMVRLVFAQGRQPEQVAVAPADAGAVAANVASPCVRRPRFRHTAGWQQSSAVAHAHPATTCGTVQ